MPCDQHKQPLPCPVCVEQEKHRPDAIIRTGSTRPDHVLVGVEQSPAVVYLFWHRRWPGDKEVWPVVYRSLELAEACKHRVGPVVPVTMPGTPTTVS